MLWVCFLMIIPSAVSDDSCRETITEEFDPATAPPSVGNNAIEFVLFGPNPLKNDVDIQITFLTLLARNFAELKYRDYHNNVDALKETLHLIQYRRTPYTLVIIEQFRSYNCFVLDIIAHKHADLVAVTYSGSTFYDVVRPAIIAHWTKEYYVPADTVTTAVLLMTNMTVATVNELAVYGAKKGKIMKKKGTQSFQHNLRRLYPKNIAARTRNTPGQSTICYHFTSNDAFTVMVLGVDRKTETEKMYMAEFLMPNVKGKIYEKILMDSEAPQDYILISSADKNEIILEKMYGRNITYHLKKGETLMFAESEFMTLFATQQSYLFLYVGELRMMGQLVPMKDYQNAYVLLFPRLQMLLRNYIFHVGTKVALRNETFDGGIFLRIPNVTGGDIKRERQRSIYPLAERYISAYACGVMGYYLFAKHATDNLRFLYHYAAHSPSNIYEGFEGLPVGFHTPTEEEDIITTAQTTITTNATTATSTATEIKTTETATETTTEATTTDPTTRPAYANFTIDDYICPMFYYGPKCSKKCTSPEFKCRNDGTGYTTECYRGSFGPGCIKDADNATCVSMAATTMRLELTEPQLSKSFTLEVKDISRITPELVLIKIWNPDQKQYELLEQPLATAFREPNCVDVCWPEPVVIMKMEIKVDYPGMACEFHLSGGRNLRGGPAVFMPNPDSEFNIEKDTTDQNTVYFVGEPPENHPELAAKLRDGNRFNSCIEAPEDYEMAIQFKEAYLLERIVITTIDSPIPFSMMVTCYSLSEEEVVKQSVNYKDIRVFYLNINKKVKHCKIKSTKGPLKLCEVDVFGDRTIIANYEEMAKVGDVTTATTITMFFGFLLLAFCLLLTIFALLQIRQESLEETKAFYDE